MRMWPALTRGLFAHGVVWGLWYAPVVFFAAYRPLDPLESIGRSAGFVATCVLLGVLFGWLRLAARSVMPVVLANTTLTLASGLPYVIHGVDAGLRSAALGPPGWVVLVIAIGALSLSKWTAAVEIPERSSGFVPGSGMLSRLGAFGAGVDDRKVH